MNTQHILSELRAERARINHAIAALEALSAKGVPGVKRGRKAKAAAAAAPKHRRRRMSAATRKRLSELAKQRWAARRKAA